MKVFFDLACMSTCWGLPKPKYEYFIIHNRDTLTLTLNAWCAVGFFLLLKTVRRQNKGWETLVLMVDVFVQVLSSASADGGSAAGGTLWCVRERSPGKRFSWKHQHELVWMTFLITALWSKSMHRSADVMWEA